MFTLVTCCETVMTALAPMFLNLVYEAGLTHGAWVVWVVDSIIWLIILPFVYVYIYMPERKKTGLLLGQK